MNIEFGDYSVKKVKSFQGREGYGYNADLYWGTKKVASILDEGCGGEAWVYWDDIEEEKVDITRTDYKGEKHTYRGTPEEKILREHIETIPLQESEYSKDGFRVDLTCFLSALVGNYEEQRQLKRWCKKKTVLHLKTQKPGEYTTLSVPYDPEMKSTLEQQFDIAEIVNERFL